MEIFTYKDFAQPRLIAKKGCSLAKWGETFLVGTPFEFFLQC